MKLRNLCLISIFCLQPSGCAESGVEEGQGANLANGDDAGQSDAGEAPTPTCYVGCSDSGAWATNYEDGNVVDTTRARTIDYRVYYPVAYSCKTPLILVSHGGNGSTSAYQRLEHLGSTYAAAGFVALHIGHRPSSSPAQHLLDRPADVSFILDRLMDGSLALPGNFGGEVDFDAIGHAGHSFGAYTAHALGAAVFTQGVFTDARVRAIVPLSPQGPGQFGAFDEGAANNSWRTVSVPAYDLIGSEELDRDATGKIMMKGWRLYPFARYPNVQDKYAVVLPGQDHDDMGDKGSPEVKTFIGMNTKAFFETYLRKRAECACLVNQVAPIPWALNRRKFEEGSSSPLDLCP